MTKITYTLGLLAELLEATLKGPGELTVTGLNSLAEAGNGELTFISNPRYTSEVAKTRAAAVLVPLDWNSPCSAPAVLHCKHPDVAFSRAGALFAPPAPSHPIGAHSTAVVGSDVSIGNEVSIGPHCTIGDRARIGDGTIIEAGCFVGMDTAVGANCHLFPNVSLREYVQLGDRVILQNGTVVGSDGFGYTANAEGVRTKVPQIGTVIVGDDVETGANVTIDRARFGATRIGTGVKIDNLVQIGHNVCIEDHAVIVAQVGIAGSSTIGRGAILAGQAGVAGHLQIGAGAIIGAQSGVTKNIEDGAYVFGTPAAPYTKNAKLQAHIRRLPELKKQVQDLQEKVNSSRRVEAQV